MWKYFKYLKLILIYVLTSNTLNAQNNIYKSLKDNFTVNTNCYCTPKLVKKYGGNHYSWKNDSDRALYSITVSTIGYSGNLSNTDINVFFNSYIKNLKNAGVANYSFIRYRGIKTLEYTVSLSSYGAWLKQLVFIKFNKSYTLTVTVKTKKEVENLMNTFKNNFEFTNY